MAVQVIGVFDYSNRLSDVVLFVDFSLNAYADAGARERELAKWMAGVPELVRTEAFYKKKPPEEIFRRFEQEMEQRFRDKFAKANEIVLNLGLVFLCTVFENFLEHVLKVVFDCNPKTLLSISKEKNLTLERALELRSYDEILQEFKDKYLYHFNRQGMEEKLKAFYSIGFEKEKLFSWELFTDEIKKRYSAWDDRTLIDILNKRHSIVHDSQYPLANIDEFLLMKDFLVKLVFNFGMMASKKYYKYGALLDAHAMMRDAIKAEGGDPETYPPTDWAEQE
jgi:hypothetical protein